MVREFTEEHKRKLSEAHKGQVAWNKGKTGLHVAWNRGIPLTEEVKLKLSIALSGENHPNFGKHLSDITKQKISESNKGKTRNVGRHLSEETKLKISKAHKDKKGNIPWNKGKKGLQVNSAETRKKLSESLKGHKGYWLGKHFSKEMRDKIRESNLGEKGNNWQGGITSIQRIIRSSAEYSNWRREVFIRDYWTCQMCGKKKGIKIRAHHIRPFKDYPELRFEIDNGITLCKTCHQNNGLHNKVLIA